MAFLGIKVPGHIGDSLQKVKVPGRREPKEQYHATLFYLGKQVPIENLTHMIEVAHDVLAKVKPFSMKLNHVTNFPSGKDGYPIICPVDSDGLKQLQREMKKAFDTEEVKYVNDFPDYKPHVTLAYADEGIDKKPFPAVNWTADEVVLWGGDAGEERLVVKFPLSSTASKKAFVVMARHILDA